MQPNKGKALTLLRTLNNLLRSLSRSSSQPSSSSISELKLRGKVHLFMANVYGISDPSGTNARGDFAPLSRSRAALRKVEGDIEMQSTEEQDPVESRFHFQGAPIARHRAHSRP
jgi:THO complex subunit 1